MRTQQISTHWIRHTTLTWVERSFGYAAARAYAGHTDGGGDVGATSTYVRASLSEVATALEPDTSAMAIPSFRCSYGLRALIAMVIARKPRGIAPMWVLPAPGRCRLAVFTPSTGC